MRARVSASLQNLDRRNRYVKDKQEADAEGAGWEKVRSRKKDMIPHKQGSVIVISKEGKSYSEILQAVKGGIDHAQLPAAAKITSIRRSGNEDPLYVSLNLHLHVSLREGKTAEAICKAVEDKFPELSRNFQQESGHGIRLYFMKPYM